MFYVFSITVLVYQIYVRLGWQVGNNKWKNYFFLYIFRNNEDPNIALNKMSGNNMTLLVDKNFFTLWLQDQLSPRSPEKKIQLQPL